jgi:hypothetical protein
MEQLPLLILSRSATEYDGSYYVLFMILEEYDESCLSLTVIMAIARFRVGMGYHTDTLTTNHLRLSYFCTNFIIAE